MEGFGSADLTTPFHYGSVHDSHLRNDTLEQKLRKQYWKTKQTVIQKLGKNQDEFIVAGDAEIDTKLEKAYHLQSSCTELLQAVDKYMTRLRNVSLQEAVMGEHLRTWSETEYTNAGEVMQNVGKLEDRDSKSRYTIIPPLMRMHREFMVFRGSAIRDLNESIQLLEKARTEYRAALLWMKDVSDKLRNPDYKDQLIRFREAQGAVKEAKRRFEKLKIDLGEKIDMVSASRCNLLSRSLPNYQKEVLDYTDTVANEFHSLLVDLRSHHHHQYKVRRVLEEIRDLEADEMPFNDHPGMDEGGDDFSALQLSESTDQKSLFNEADDPLLDLGADSGNEGENKAGDTDKGGEGSEMAAEEDSKSDMEQGKPEQDGKTQDGKTQDAYRRVGDPFSFEKVAEQAKVKDLVLGGIEAELKALQDEVLNPRSSSRGKTSTSPTAPAVTSAAKSEASATEQSRQAKSAKSQAEKEIEDLLKLDSDLPDDSSLLLDVERRCEEGVESVGQDVLSSEWNNFSAFMPATRGESGSKSPLSGWEKELMGSPSSGSLPDPLPPTESGEAAAVVPPPPSSQAQTQSSSGKDETPTSSSASGGASVEANPVSDLVPSLSSVPAPSDSLPPSFGNGKDHAPSKSVIDNDSSIDKLLGLGGANHAESAESSGGGSGGVADELLSEELHSLGISPVKKAQNSSTPQMPTQSAASGSDIGSIDSTLFGLHSSQPNLPPQPSAMMGSSSAMYPISSQLPQPQPQVSPFRSPLGTTQGPPVFPTQGAMGMAMAPPKFGLVGPPAPGVQQQGVTPPAVGGASAMGGETKDKDEKGKTWMNFFAHLDPLVNEKA